MCGCTQFTPRRQRRTISVPEGVILLTPRPTMPSQKAKAKPAKHATPNRWAAAEIEALVDCLRDEQFIKAHAASLPVAQFPEFTLRDALVKDSEAQCLCIALSKEILSRAGSHNADNPRPFASIAQKLCGWALQDDRRSRSDHLRDRDSCEGAANS